MRNLKTVWCDNFAGFFDCFFEIWVWFLHVIKRPQKKGYLVSKYLCVHVLVIFIVKEIQCNNN